MRWRDRILQFRLTEAITHRPIFQLGAIYGNDITLDSWLMVLPKPFGTGSLIEFCLVEWVVMISEECDLLFTSLVRTNVNSVETNTVLQWLSYGNMLSTDNIFYLWQFCDSRSEWKIFLQREPCAQFRGIEYPVPWVYHIPVLMDIAKERAHRPMLNRSTHTKPKNGYCQ